MGHKKSADAPNKSRIPILKAPLLQSPCRDPKTNPVYTPNKSPIPIVEGSLIIGIV